MIRKILELSLGPMTDAEFAEVMDLTTTDIKVNRIGYGKRTSLRDVVEIARICLGIIQRCRVA